MVLDEDEELIQRAVKPIFDRGMSPLLSPLQRLRDSLHWSVGAIEGPDGARCRWEISSLKETDAFVAVVCFRHTSAEVIQDAQDVMRVLGPHVLSIRLFYNPSRTAYSKSLLQCYMYSRQSCASSARLP